MVDAQFREPLEIKDVDVEFGRFKELMAGNVLFPRRIVQGRLSSTRRGGFRREARAFFMDASKIEDIVDFWNLRALGHETIAVPKQLQAEPAIKEYVVSFLKRHRIPRPHNPNVYDSASFVRSRNSTMEEMQKFAESLTGDLPKPTTAHDSFFSLQHWYPRIWDEWARDKDGAVPHDFYADEAEYDITDTASSTVQIKLALPEFAEEYGYHDEPRCANDVSIRVYGSRDYGAEVLPNPAGEHVLQAARGRASFRYEWRVDHNGLVGLVRHKSKEPYCWNDELKRRFNHLAGLLAICNATQQVYLGLPSWEAEWHEGWEKKRLKRVAKLANQNKVPQEAPVVDPQANQNSTHKSPPTRQE